MAAQNQEIHKVDYQLAEDNRKLIPRNQCSSNIARSDFSDIHRTDGRCQSNPYTAQNPVEIECNQKGI